MELKLVIRFFISLQDFFMWSHQCPAYVNFLCILVSDFHAQNYSRSQLIDKLIIMICFYIQHMNAVSTTIRHSKLLLNFFFHQKTRRETIGFCVP